MKIGFLITARLKSKRLPFKILKDLNGKTVIERIIDRGKAVKDISEIVLCTSNNPQDRPLVDIAKNNRIYYYNGSEEDVLQRLLEAARLFSLDYFIGITADNPLFTIHYSNLIVDTIKRKKYDYVKLSGLPLGCATYGIGVKALETVCRIKSMMDTEIWGPLLDRPDLFNIKTIHIMDSLKKPELRLTLDYIEDYELLRHIYNHFHYSSVVNLYDVVNFLEENPHLQEINKHCGQVSLSEKDKNDIEAFYEKNHQYIKVIKEKIYGNT